MTSKQTRKTGLSILYLALSLPTPAHPSVTLTLQTQYEPATPLPAPLPPPTSLPRLNLSLWVLSNAPCSSAIYFSALASRQSYLQCLSQQAFINTRTLSCTHTHTHTHTNVHAQTHTHTPARRTPLLLWVTLSVTCCCAIRMCLGRADVCTASPSVLFSAGGGLVSVVAPAAVVFWTCFPGGPGAV